MEKYVNLSSFLPCTHIVTVARLDTFLLRLRNTRHKQLSYFRKETVTRSKACLASLTSSKLIRYLSNFRYVAHNQTVHQGLFKYLNARFDNFHDNIAPVKTVEEIVDPLKAKLDAAIKLYAAQFAAWKMKWTAYHVEYVKKYKKILTERHEWYINYVISQFICRWVFCDKDCWCVDNDWKWGSRRCFTVKKSNLCS